MAESQAAVAGVRWRGGEETLEAGRVSCNDSARTMARGQASSLAAVRRWREHVTRWPPCLSHSRGPRHLHLGPWTMACGQWTSPVPCEAAARQRDRHTAGRGGAGRRTMDRLTRRDHARALPRVSDSPKLALDLDRPYKLEHHRRPRSWASHSPPETSPPIDHGFFQRQTRSRRRDRGSVRLRGRADNCRPARLR